MSASTQRMHVAAFSLAAALAACSAGEPDQTAAGTAGAGAERAQSALSEASAAPSSAQEQAARAEAAASIESQSAARQDEYRSAAAMAERTALATQREVLEQMKAARERASGDEAGQLAADISEREARVAKREERLRELDRGNTVGPAL